VHPHTNNRWHKRWRRVCCSNVLLLTAYGAIMAVLVVIFVFRNLIMRMLAHHPSIMLFWLMMVIVNVVAVEPFFGEIFTSILNALQIQLGNYVITTSRLLPNQYRR
jgi:hypothetical protein